MVLTRERLRAVVERATWAPSIHNTQPWRFRLGDDAVDLYADRARAVPVIDPSGRQLVISCGAALLYARLGVREQGHEVDVTLLPERDDPDHLARIGVGQPRPTDGEELSLLAVIPHRHMYREPFANRPVPSALVDVLRHGVTAEGAWLHVLDRSDDLVMTATLLARADAAEMADPAYAEELRRWSRFDEGATDGIPRSAVPRAGSGGEGRRSTVVLRDLDVDASVARAAENAPVERPLVVLLGTSDDDRRAWLDAGQALGWLLLRAAVDGVAASPLNQVLDLPAARTLLARELRLVGYPQMLLRMGYASPESGTGRRPVDDVID